MAIEEERGYYASMVNALRGLTDDFDANDVPKEAKELLEEIIAICQSDFNIRFDEELR